MPVTYNVYFDSVLPVSIGQSALTLAVPDSPLTYGGSYLWRVDSVNEFGTTTGDEWSFGTIGFHAPRTSARYKSDNSVVPSGTSFDSDTMYFTGENFMGGVVRLVAAAAAAIWYEGIYA